MNNNTQYASTTISGYQLDITNDILTLAQMTEVKKFVRENPNRVRFYCENQHVLENVLKRIMDER